MKWHENLRTNDEIIYAAEYPRFAAIANDLQNDIAIA